MKQNAEMFALSIINGIAAMKQRRSTEVYDAIKRTRCLDHYLIPYYEILNNMDPVEAVQAVLQYLEDHGEAL